MPDKQELRKIMLAKRRALSEQEQAVASAAICRRLAKVLAANPRGAVLSYLAYGREVDLGALHQELWRQGRALAVPRTHGLPPGQMEAAQYLPQTELTKIALGVWEPLTAAALDPAEIGVVLAPGVAFDEAGNRLGHGRGYYDRYLAKLGGLALTVGVGYRWQVVPAVPVDAFDRPMDMLICS